MLGQRRRRWANISPTLGQRLVFAGQLTANKKLIPTPKPTHQAENAQLTDTQTPSTSGTARAQNDILEPAQHSPVSHSTPINNTPATRNNNNS